MLDTFRRGIQEKEPPVSDLARIVVGPAAAPSGAAPPDGDAFETPSTDPR